MITVPEFTCFAWLRHGFGLRDSILPYEISARIRTVRQIHSGTVLDAAECADVVRDGDALISRESGVVVGVKTADCVPILLVDPVTRAVAAVHAGWRGTVENIVGNTVRALQDKFGVQPADILAAIGPSIGPCCYEVGPEVAVRFGFQTGAGGTGKTQLDLPAVNERQLRETGVKSVWKSGECTYCSPERFFSFRREREAAGRMMSFVGHRQEN
jgi:YfiH family protein